MSKSPSRAQKHRGRPGAGGRLLPAARRNQAPRQPTRVLLVVFVLDRDQLARPGRVAFDAQVLGKLGAVNAQHHAVHAVRQRTGRGAELAAPEPAEPTATAPEPTAATTSASE